MWSGHSCPLVFGNCRQAGKTARSIQTKVISCTMIGAVSGKPMIAKRMQTSSHME
jgi:hypothetical protein